MGKKWNECLNCNKSYFGQGKKFCSINCKNEYSVGKKLIISEEHKIQHKINLKLAWIKRKEIPMSNETKEKISISSKNRWEDKEYHDNMCAKRKGHIVKEETKEKIRKSQKNRKNPWTVKYNKNREHPEKWHHTEEAKQKIREKVSGIKNGQYGKPPTNIKPFIFIDKLGRSFLLRSSWEEKLAKYFDDNNIKWDYEKTTYLLSDGSTYTPDFFTDDKIFEVKGFFYKRSIEKFKLFMIDFPSINIILADKIYLEKILNIKL